MHANTKRIVNTAELSGEAKCNITRLHTASAVCLNCSKANLFNSLRCKTAVGTNGTLTPSRSAVLFLALTLDNSNLG